MAVLAVGDESGAKKTIASDGVRPPDARGVSSLEAMMAEFRKGVTD